MRIFNWAQNKLYRKQGKKVSNSGSDFSHNTVTSNSRKEEFDDWQTLLAIGTLGENKMKEDTSRNEPPKSSQASQDLPDFTPEVVKLQKEITKLLTQKPKTSTDESEIGKEGRANLPVNRFLNCPSSLDVDQTACTNVSDNSGNDDDADLSANAKIILTRVKDLLADNRNGIKKTSLKFLVKKMFVCHGGFVPPTLRDPLPESRIEKILRATLHKKIYPQSSAQPTTKKYMNGQTSVMRYLENKPTDIFQVDKRKVENGEESSKWVKTDSEYIVLEI